MDLPCIECKFRTEREQGHRRFFGCSDKEKKAKHFKEVKERICQLIYLISKRTSTTKSRTACEAELRSILNKPYLQERTNGN